MYAIINQLYIKHVKKQHKVYKTVYGIKIVIKKLWPCKCQEKSVNRRASFKEKKYYSLDDSNMARKHDRASL